MRSGMIFQVNIVMTFEATFKGAFCGCLTALALLLHFCIKLFTPIIGQSNILFERLFG